MIAIDTRITVAIAELQVAVQDTRGMSDLGITDLPDVITGLEAHLVRIRERTGAMFAEAYPVQP
jgi:hypothetical protein